MTDLLVERVNEHVGRVTFNRPAKRNAISFAMWQGLGEAFESFDSDEQIRAVILTGSGGCFSAGADISEFAHLRSNAALGQAYDEATERSGVAIMASRKPVIAAIEGYCIGGGLGLAVACDFRFAHAGATFGIPAARLGVVYGQDDTRNLLNVVGLAQAKRILCSAEFFDASRAERIGLVDEVVSDDVDTMALNFANRLTANAPLSIQASKTLLNTMTSGDSSSLGEVERKLIAAALESEDYKEGVSAFGEKRQPTFQGR